MNYRLLLKFAVVALSLIFSASCSRNRAAPKSDCPAGYKKKASGSGCERDPSSANSLGGGDGGGGGGGEPYVPPRRDDKPDLDGDGIPDDEDPDIDGDGIENDDDPEPRVKKEEPATGAGDSSPSSSGRSGSSPASESPSTADDDDQIISDGPDTTSTPVSDGRVEVKLTLKQIESGPLAVNVRFRHSSKRVSNVRYRYNKNETSKKPKLKVAVELKFFAGNEECTVKKVLTDTHIVKTADDADGISFIKDNDDDYTCQKRST